jgi:hypothetical protein
MANQVGLQRGTTLFSFTNEFHGRQYTLDQLIAKVAELDLGPGVELVGFSHVRGFPKVTDEFAEHFRGLLQKYGLVASCLGLNADMYIRPEQPMTQDELLAYHEAQIDAAAKLGFPVVRYQFLAGTEVVKRLLPKAERLNVKLGLEIHAPEKVNSPMVLEYREMYEKVNSPYLGFVPDFGSTAKRVSPAFIRYFRELGIPEPLIALVQQIWMEPDDLQNIHGKIPQFASRAKAAGFRDVDIAECFIVFGLFSRQSPKAWLEIMPQVVHIHGKFYHFNEDGSESAIPYEEILPVFIEGGYNGYMSSEWEGHFFCDDNGLDMVKKHHELCKRIISQYSHTGTRTVLSPA